MYFGYTILTQRLLLPLLFIMAGYGSVQADTQSVKFEEIDFGTAILGDTSTRAVFVSVNQVPNETWGQLYNVSPPLVNTTLTGPVAIADTFAFIFQFRPMAGGVYADSTAIVRYSNGVARDTIVVRMSGTGRSLSADATINFFPTMTGDFQVRSEDFYGPAYVINQYQVDRRPQAPFITSLVNDKPSVSDPDSIRVSVAFEPTVQGTFTDTLVMIRSTATNIPLDTLRIALSATSLVMKTDTTVLFEDVTVGSIDTLDVFVRLPALFVTRSFQYELASLDPGPLTGTVDPNRPTRRTVLTNEIVASPSEFRNVRQRFMLRRTSTQTGEQWDSTEIIIDLVMMPRPIAFHLEWDQNPLVARIGDTVNLTLQAVTYSPFDSEVALVDLNVDLEYNPTVFVPLPGLGQTRIVQDDSVWMNIKLPGSEVLSSGQVTPLATIRAIVALGDSDHSPLIPSNATLGVKGEDAKPVAADSGRMNITNVFRYADGTPRYINPLQASLEMSISPNPGASVSTITLGQVPSGKGALQIIDVMGQVVAELSSQVRSGSRAFTVSSGGGTDVTVMAGSYYARLTVEGDQPNSYARLVRLFIVQ